MRLDSAVLEGRRRELGLSMRFVAQEASLSLTVLATLERTGEAGYLTLNTVGLLAAALGVKVSNLLVEEEQANRLPEAEASSQLAEMGSALLRFPEGLSPEALALALGESVGEVERLLGTLDTALQRCGIALFRRDGRVLLVSRPAQVATTDAIGEALKTTQTRSPVDRAPPLSCTRR